MKTIIQLVVAVTTASALIGQTSTPQKPLSNSPAAGSSAAKTPAAPSPQTITTASGLKYVDLVVGAGPMPKRGDTVVVNYTGRFTNGKVFATSVGKKPFEFTLGQGQVIKGWDE